eukprot:12835465-Alexandrium_andersonii.AAC.1
MRKAQNRFRRSNLELREPRNGLKIGPRSSRGVCSPPLFAQNQNLQTSTTIEGVRSREIANSRTGPAR